MPLFEREEGPPVPDASAMRRMLPFLMPGRNEAVVYFEQILDVSRALAYIARREAEGVKVSLFQVILAAMLRTFEQRPALNRFIAGSRLRQRRKIEFSFAIKRAMSDEAPLTTTKITLEPGDGVAKVGERMAQPIREGRAGKKTTSDTEMALITRLPGFAVRWLLGLQRLLDAWGLLPAAMIRADPLYTSMFFTNLGSVGLDSAYHHLFEYGTCPFFVAVGRVKKAVLVGEDGQPVVRDVVSLKFSFDERIADGLYCARSLELFRAHAEDPDTLVP